MVFVMAVPSKPIEPPSLPPRVKGAVQKLNTAAPQIKHFFVQEVEKGAWEGVWKTSVISVPNESRNRGNASSYFTFFVSICYQDWQTEASSN